MHAIDIPDLAFMIRKMVDVGILCSADRQNYAEIMRNYAELCGIMRNYAELCDYAELCGIMRTA